jgi:hypothetical protein
MVPIPDDPETPRSVRADPVRIVVQAALVLYLLPVVLLVCLIGTTAILAGGTARIVGRVTGKLRRREERPTISLGRSEAGELGTRPIADRKPSQVVG